MASVAQLNSFKGRGNSPPPELETEELTPDEVDGVMCADLTPEEEHYFVLQDEGLIRIPLDTLSD